MTQALRDAARAFRRAETHYLRRRDELASAIVDAAVADVPQVEIVRITGYTRENIRRIVKHAADSGARPGDSF